MTLISRDTPPQVIVRRQLVRLALLMSTSSVAFVLILSAAAWWTRDAPVGVPHEATDVPVRVADAGPAFVDAGSAPPDAGELVTVAGDIDAGPAQVTPPPIDAAALGAIIGTASQGCLEDALRFDPSLGGNASVSLQLGGDDPPRARLLGVSSPLFSRCLLARVEALALPQVSERVELRVGLALDGLRSSVSVTSAELVVDVTR
jgi:hypothetical protein